MSEDMKQCPECGACRKPWKRRRAEFECGSYLDRLGRLCKTVNCLEEKTRQLSAKLAQARAEIERLRKMVGKLPTTKDGVSVGPGDLVYRYEEDEDCVIKFKVLPFNEWESVDDDDEAGNREVWAMSSRGFGRMAEDCYSTRATAEAASKS